MPTISLTSFMKILTKGTPQKVAEYSKYLTPGGYDFYWQLKEAAHAFTVGGESFADCAKPIEASPRDVERKHNLDCLKALRKWREKQKPESFFSAPVAAHSSPAGLVTIKIEPEFGAVISGQHRIVQLWAAKGSNLTRAVAGVGIYLMQRNLCIGESAHCKAGILDLRKGELYVADALPRNVEAIVTSELAWLDGFFRQVSRAA